MFDVPVFCCYKILELIYFFITSQNNASFIHFIFEEIINEHSDALWFGIYWLLVCTQEKKQNTMRLNKCLYISNVQLRSIR